MALGVLAPAEALAARVDVCGDISSGTLWTAANVYVVNDCLLRVAAGVTLSVQPGTVVKFAGPRAVLLVQGALSAQGTPASPISFTAIADDSRGGDTNGDGASSGSAGSWGGIRFDAGSQGTIANAFLGFGGSGHYDHGGRYNAAILESLSSNVSVDGATVRESGRHGVWVFAASVNVARSRFFNNAQFGLFYEGVGPSVPLNIEDNEFSGSGTQAGRLALNGAAQVAVSGNSAEGARNGFRVDGTLAAGSLAWDNEDDLPLVVDGALTIESGATLNIASGTIAKFSGPRSVLRVRGSAFVGGTESAPVVLTSAEDDSHGGDTNGGGASSGAPGQWAGLRFEAGSQGRLTHATFFYGASGHYDHVGRYNLAMLETFESDVSLDHCELRAGALNGAYAENASLAVNASVFAGNGQYGLRYNGVDPAAGVTVRDSGFQGNGIQAGWLHVVDTGTQMEFRNNRGTGARNGFRIDGRLTSGSLTWDNGDALPLLVDGGFTVGGAASLRLEAGSVVKFAGPRDLILVQGSLAADGAAGAPVVLTAIADDTHGGDTNGDGPSTAGAGQWGGLRFAAGSSGRLQYVEAAYGGSGHYDHAGVYNKAIVESYSSEVTLDRVVVRHSGLHGLYAYGAGVAVTNSTLAGNAQYGLYFEGIDPLVPLVITDNDFSGPGAGAARLVVNGNPSSIVFTRNTGGGTGFRGGFSLSGTLNADTQWENSESLPLVVDGGLTVAAGSTLSLSPGTVVKFAGPRDVLLVLGELVADGTESAPIAFTSLNDDSHGGDTNGDGPSNGTSGQWGGLRFAEGSAGSLSHVFVGYGGSGHYDFAGAYNLALVESYSSDVPLDRITLHGSGRGGLYAWNASVSVSDGTISDNAHDGIFFDGIAAGTPLAVRRNAFSGNGYYGARLRLGNTAGQIDLEDNATTGSRNGFRLDGRLASGLLRWQGGTQSVVIDGGLAISPGALLRLEAGAVVKFAGPRDVLQIEGTMEGMGSFSLPIALTSIADDTRGGDTNGDGPSTGRRGQWGGLRVLGGRADLGHAAVAYGGSGHYDHLGRYGAGLVELRGGEARILHGTIAGSGNAGVYAEAGQAVLNYNAIVDHGGSAVHNASAGTVDARRNWWGDATGPRHPSLNPGGNGGSVGNGVRFEPWLDRYAWMEPARSLLHGVEALSWRAFELAPALLAVEVSARDGDRAVTLGRTLPGAGALDWDTRTAADGPYELRAAFRDGSGRTVAEPVLPVAINNDASIEWHGGRVTGSEVWSASRLHVVEADVIVGAGARLDVEPGAVVKFLPGTRLIVEAGGIADAPATAEAPIVLTSIGDDSAGGDTNLDGGRSRPRPGDWGGAQIDAAGQFNRSDFVDVRYSQTTHAGALTADETWLGSMIHGVTADVTVPSGVTLTIEAGAIVKFDRYLGIVLQPGARLFAQGTSAQPVIFTSIRDDTAGGDSNADGDTTVPAPGDWRWLYVDGAEAVIDHAELRYGAGTASRAWEQTGMVRTTGNSSVTIRDSVLRDALFDGVLAWGGSVAVVNSILANIDRAISAHPGSPVDVINCTVDGNRIGLLVHGGLLDVVNTVASNNAVSGIQYDFGTLRSVRHTDVWKPPGSASVNYLNTPDQTGSAGNISADPAYVARAQGNYRLDYLSPLIDAADGTAATPADHFGAPRYDDPRSPNTGTPASGGAFADIGAWEFVESAPSPIDLVVTRASGPSAVVAGETARVSWTVTNAGTAEAVGPWHDTINLVHQPNAGSETNFAAEVLTGQGKRLGPGQSLDLTAEVRVPGSLVAEHRWQVVANTRAEVFEGANRANNATLSTAPVAVDLPELVIDGAALVRGFAAAREPHWFKFDPSAGEDVLVRLDRAGTGGATELYLGRGYVPTRQRFDARQQESAAADAAVLAAGTSAQTYYVLAYPASLPPGSESFDIRAAAVPFSIESVGPAEVGNAGSVTLAVRGGKLHEDLRFEIVDGAGGAHSATAVFVTDSSLAYATFDLGGLPPGAYSVRVSGGPQTIAAPSAISVISGRAGKVWASLVMPDALRPDWTDVATIEYGNDGGADVVAPLLFLSIGNARLRLPGQEEFAGSTLQLLGINGQGPAGILPPGARGTITVEIKPTGGSNLAGKLWVVTDQDRPIDWNALEAPMRPEFVPQDAWRAIFANFKGAIGETVGEMHAALARDATHLSRLGEYTPDVRRLLGLELNHAGVGYLTERYTLGVFGRGALAWWEMRLRSIADGRMAVIDSGGFRFFQPRAGGGYVGIGGERGTLTRTAEGFELSEPEGLLIAFDSGGRLAYVEDANGNRITAGYSEGRLATVTSSDGGVIAYEYDGHGRVVEATDSVGRMVEYEYDASGEHLTRIADGSGTTHLTYVTGGGPALEHALDSMSFADGTAIHFEYDSRGRLARHHGGGGVEALNLSYEGPGSVAVTDASGVSRSVLLGADGAPGRLTDAGGESIRIEYDHRRLPVVLRGPDGSAVRAEYDAAAMPSLIVDPLGNRLGAVFENGLQASATNARGATTRHEYDGKGNRVRTIFPDGASEQFAYDDKGTLVGWTNGRGRGVSYDVDAAGKLAREVLPDGSSRQREYDEHGNVKAITDARGAIAFTYDSADQLTKVTYPGGRFLRFEYDAAGRRTRMEDQGGFVLRYGYDAQGRLARVSDGGDEPLATYEYDIAGRVRGKVLGNGVRTDFTYDDHGRIAAMVNARADSSVVSRFSYEYDVAGRRIRSRTDEGEWRYEYDGDGRLAKATFVPDGGGLASRDLRYAYDAAGNRTSIVRDGAETSYSANLADQYTGAGNADLEYDADGNLTERRGAAGNWLYEYDDEGRLVRVSGPPGVWVYEYDSLGHRVATVENGTRREYVVDPISGQPVAVYDGAGEIASRYVHGFDLTARIDAGGAIAYYALDALGSASEVLDQSGAVLNVYRYEPFGEEHGFASTLEDPFRYLGGYGVEDDGNGLLFMRARYYDPSLGRFTQRDPMGGAQGPNLYEYAGSDPVNRIDPFGAFWGSELFWAAGRFMGSFGPLTDGELWVVISNSHAFDRIRQFEKWREFHEWWRHQGSLRHGLKEFGKYTLNQARSGLRFASNLVRSGVGNLVRTLGSMQIQITNVPSWIMKIPAAISSVGTTLGTSVTALGAGTIATGVAVAGAVGVAIGTGLRYIPGVDEGAQSAWIKLNDWTGGWLFGTPPAAEAGTRIVSSFDPNDILGPAGYGAARWVSSDAIMAYTIRFENEASASAPAQVVRVVQQLDPDLDFAAFQLGSFGFGDLIVHVPPGRRYHSQRIDLTASAGLLVDVTAEIDMETGLAVWELRSIDPATGLPPRDPFAGFLPPNETSPMGEGFVSYTVRALPSVTGGQWVDARARIFFDTNEPIDTPAHLNTLDADEPWSQVEPLPEVTYSPAVRLRWSGSDGGAGVAAYDVYVSVEGGTFGRWLAGVADTTAVYPGAYGYRYEFYTIARDHTGRAELPPPSADAATRVEPLSGDANCDGAFTAADLTALIMDLRTGMPGACPSDGDADGDADEDDLALLYELLFGY